MDLVVRTPHGDADVTVFDAGDTTTVGDVIELVTAQAAPPVVRIDGRTVDATAPLEASGAVNGSLVSTLHDPTETTSSESVGILQLSGRGAGAIRRLDDGRYRVGPGRRSSARELDDGPVDTSILELVIESGEVTIEPSAGMAISLDGVSVTEPTVWSEGDVVVGGRVFGLERPAQPASPRRLDRGSGSGTIPFSRSPRSATVADSLPFVDAVRRSVARHGLWAIRPGDPEALELPFGIVVDTNEGTNAGTGHPRTTASVNMQREPAVAIAGSEPFRHGVARALLLEATTRHGPADLDVVIATNAAQLGDWDWAKWLPHVRVLGEPMLLSSDAELMTWADSTVDEARAGRQRWLGPHWTLLVIDDPALWKRRDSPLQTIMASRPVSVRAIALCDRVDAAPAMCTAVIAENSGGRALMSRRSTADVLPALVEVDLVAEVARLMAPLDDAELPLYAHQTGADLPVAELSDVIEFGTDAAATIESRWAQTAHRPDALRVPIGVRPSGEVVDVEVWTDISFRGSTSTDVARATLSYLTALATVLPPRTAPLLHLFGGDSSLIADALSSFVHLAGSCSVDDVVQLHRVVERLEHVVSGGDHVFVVAEFLDDVDGDSGASPGQHWLDELVADHPTLHLIGATTATALGGGAAIHVNIGRRAGEIRGISGGRAGPTTLFVPLAAGEEPPTTGLRVRPMVFGRSLTPLERRLDRTGASVHQVSADKATNEVLAAVARAAGDERAMSLVPPALPSFVDLDQLLADNPADAIPIGLADNAATGTIEPAWWQPSESLLIVGSPRSGVDRLLSTLIVGIADRFAADDLHVYAIDPVARRRSVIESLPHTGATASVEQLDRVVALIELVTDEVHERRSRRDEGRGDEGRGDEGDQRDDPLPTLVVLIHDLGQLGRRLHDSRRTDMLALIRALAEAGDVGVTLVATAVRPSDSYGIDALVDQVIIGSLSTVGDAVDVGLDDAIMSDLLAGRCWSMTSSRRLQLATLDRPLSDAIDASGLEQPSITPPRRAGRPAR